MSPAAKTIKHVVIPAIVIALVTGLLCFALFQKGYLDIVELKTLDLRFVLRGEKHIKNENAKDVVKIIAIDAKTVAHVGRWPWPRGVVATLMAGICSGDLETFDGEDEWVNIETEDGWEDVPGEGNAELPTAETEGTKEDATQAVETPLPNTENIGAEKNAPTLGVRSVLGMDILFDRKERPFEKFLYRDGLMMDPAEQDDMAVEAITLCDAMVHTSLMKFPVKGATETNLGRGDESETYETDGGEVVYNLPLKKFQLKNTSHGFVNMLTSTYDERVRKARLYYRLGDKTIYSFALMNLAAFLGVDEKDIRVEDGTVTVGEFKIPVNESGEIYINFRGREYEAGEPGALFKENVLSALDIIETPETMMLMAANHIFLVGVTDPEMRDIFFTPFAIAKKQFPNNSSISGVEVHKEIIDTIMQGKYLSDAPTSAVLTILLLGALIVAAATLARMLAGIVATVLLGAGWSYFAFTAFNSTGTIYPVFYISLALPLSLAASIAWRSLVVDREKKAVKNIFKSYVAPHVLNELMERPGDLKLGGTKSKVTVLFSDIRGFTGISEQLEPEVLIQGLNTYLSEMTDIILENSGMVDKFIGDAVMAIWGAPIARSDDAKKAVTAAVRMNAALDKLNPGIEKLCGVRFYIGVGLNTGEAVLGNIGSEGKLDYTVIGNTVNLASRLEGLTKQYGAFCIISETTYGEVKDDFDCRLLDFVMVKGKHQPVAIYEALCEKDRLDESRKEMLKDYNKGLELYRECRWDRAIESFKKAAETNNDKAAILYIDRCRHYKDSPPPEDWDGSFAWKTK